MIDITLEQQKRQIDLQVPTNLTLGELKLLITKVFKENNEFLPDNWMLLLKDKAIVMSDYDFLDEFPIGNGDIFEILELGVE